MIESFGFAFHLMQMDEEALLTSVDEIKFAVVTSATPTTTIGNAVTVSTNIDGIAGNGDHGTHQPCRLVENHKVASFKRGVSHLVHHHTVAFSQCRHDIGRDSVDGESEGAHGQEKNHEYAQCYDELGKLPHLILSTHLNIRFQRTPANPLRSGSELHQIKMGLPTIWSSGTNPQ